MNTRKILASIAFVASIASVAFSAQSPSPWLDFSLSSSQITANCGSLIKRTDENLKNIADLKEKRDFKNTTQAFEQTMANFSDASSGLSFFKSVSTNKSIREASAQCDASLQTFAVGVYTREDLYKAQQEYAALKENLEGEDKKLLRRILFDFKRNGLALPADKRKKVKELKQKLVSLESAFQQNLNEYEDHLDLTRQELDGLPEDYIAKLSTAPAGKFRVTLAYPDYVPFMENAKNADLRRDLEFKFNNRASRANGPLFKQALALREEIAHLMGYETHAHYVLEDRMAKNPEAVHKFLESLQAKLKPLAEKELEVLKELKKQEGREKADKMNIWEWRYYDNMLKKTKYQLDSQKIKEYFPMQKVTKEMLAIYQEVLGLKFKEVKPAYAWHPDVRQFAVHDKSDGRLIGYFYMDLYPREGKYGHAAAFGLTSGLRRPDGTYQPPVASIVANFNKPGSGRPSLLDHDEVETFFHEFGHIMHGMLTQAKYARFSGTSVAWDFVEAPSQMFENWAWNPQMLKRISGHYKTGKPLPEDILKRMIEAKNLNAGLRYLRQAFFASVDQEYHRKPPADTTALYGELQNKIALIPKSTGTHPEASFGHLMGGYDSSYYGYLWSEVYAQDMFSRFQKEGILNAATGGQYRRQVLEKGSSVDEAEEIRAFLGREPNDEAFLNNIGLK